MKKYSLLLSLSAVAIVLVVSLSSENKTTSTDDLIPNPLKVPTQVYNTMANEEEFEERKHNYWELIHGGDQFDWRAINRQHLEEKIENRLLLLGSKAVESYANGALAGEWIEKGSNDNAGNVRVTAYDPLTDAIYAIGDGGILFKGNLNGSGWQPLNDHYLLDRNVLQAIHLPDGTLRLLATKGHRVWYSDDEGQTWAASTGFSGSSTGSGIDMIELNDADSTLVYLYTYNGISSSQNRLAYSKDHGVSFTLEHTFLSNNPQWASMAAPYNGSIAYVLDRDDDVWMFENDQLVQITSGMNLQGNSTCQVEVTTSVTDTILYVLMDDQYLFKSTDAGYNFTQLNDLPVPAWEIGIGVSIDDPDAVYFGEVELYRSSDGGNNFTKVADWWEYYSDVANKIHADIMNIQTYKKANGTEFTLISNHGGLNVSYDNLNTTPNIGLLNLNVGQFYDVATSPVNSSFIFGGTQDQGLQRTAIGTVPGSVSFEQVISGDYGQQQFSNNGQSFWTQYPGADFSYYANATTDGGAAYWYQVDGTDKPNAGWIVPTGAAPNPSDDYILVGGGNLNGGSGSYLVKLTNTGGAALPSQFSFDFMAASGRPIAAIETTPYDPNKWYVSTENGRFYHSEDAGLNWTAANVLVGPGNDWIYSSDIYASRLTEGLVFLGGTNYIITPVYMSEDGGATFVPLNQGALPSTMVHELCMDAQENFLFAATDAGPYVYDMQQQEWFDLAGTDAPIQEYISCEFVAAENVVRFATWGRGIWDFNLSDVTATPDFSVEDSEVAIYPNPSKGQCTIQVAEASKVRIFTADGKMVTEVGLVPGANQLNLGFLKSGYYLMVGVDTHGKMWKEKLVIE